MHNSYIYRLYYIYINKTIKNINVYATLLIDNKTDTLIMLHGAA